MPISGIAVDCTSLGTAQERGGFVSATGLPDVQHVHLHRAAKFKGILGAANFRQIFGKNRKNPNFN